MVHGAACTVDSVWFPVKKAQIQILCELSFTTLSGILEEVYLLCTLIEFVELFMQKNWEGERNMVYAILLILGCVRAHPQSDIGSQYPHPGQKGQERIRTVVRKQ